MKEDVVNKMKSVSMFVSFFAVILFMCTGCNKQEGQTDTLPEAPEEKIAVVEVMPLDVKTFTAKASFFGEVQGIAEATLVSYGGGEVAKLKVKSGQTVKKGQSLCNIDGEKFSLATESALLNQKVAEGEYKRAQEHLQKETYSQLQVDKIHQGYLLAKQMVLDALKMKRGALCECPISGVVTHTFIEENQNLPPGSPTISVAQLHKVKIKVNVSEGDIQGLVLQGKAYAVLPDGENRIEGVINSISQQVLAKNRSFLAEAWFPNKGHRLKPGQTIEVILYKKPLKDVIVVPSEAILSLEKESVVMIMKDNKAVKIPVIKGPADARETVISSGLTAGDQLIIKGHALVSDGAQVKVVR
ncbi:MAG: efflux RND transporter periplasmic adaptor subunit [Fibrobacteria bacterium]|nr:efflux RND transporter periplasmic adaptor subunit [Fibrobacteria bacterium]